MEFPMISSCSRVTLNCLTGPDGWVDISKEIFSEILPKLEKIDLYSAVKVCKLWGIRIVTIVAENEIAAIRELATCIGANVEGDQRDRIINFSSKTFNPFPKSLKQMTKATCRIKEELLDVVLELSNLDKIQESLPIAACYAKKFFKTVIYCKRMSVSNLSIRFEAQCSVLLQAGLTVKALEMAKKIYDEAESDSYLQDIFEILLQEDDLDNALDAAMHMTDAVQRDNALSVISGAFLENGEIAKALHTAENMLIDPTPKHKGFARDDALQDVTQAALKIGDLNLAREAALRISMKIIRDPLLHDIALALVKNGKREDALALARQMIVAGKSSSLLCICRDCLAQGDKDRALEIAMEIPKQITRDEAFADVSEFLLNRDDCDNATEVAKLIVDRLKSVMAFLLISKAWLRKGELDKVLVPIKTMFEECKGIENGFYKIFDELLKRKEEAMLAKIIEVIQAMSDEFEKSSILDVLLCVVVENIKVDRAIEIVKKLFSLKRICQALVESGLLDQAIDLAKTIPNSCKKRGVFRGIFKKFIDLNKTTEALEVVEIFNLHERIFALSDIAQALIMKGQMEEAFDVIGKIPTDSPERQFWLKFFFKMLIYMDKTEQAVQFAQTFQSESDINISFAAITKTLAKIGKTSKAIKIAKEKK